MKILDSIHLDMGVIKVDGSDEISLKRDVWNAVKSYVKQS